MKRNILFRVENQSITRTGDFPVYSSSKNYLQAEFTFLGDEWNGVSKTAIFVLKYKDKDGVKEVMRRALMENDRCMVPWEVLNKPGDLLVSVFGGDRVTTGQAWIHVGDSGYEDCAFSDPPTPNYYAQVLAAAEQAKDVAESVRKDADEGIFTGPAGPQGEPGEAGKSAYQSYVDNGGVLTEAQWIAAIARPEGPTFANSVEDMTDTSKVYVMSDGHLWAYMRSKDPVELTESIGGDFLSGTRVSANDGSLKTDYSDFVTTPLIDVTKYLSVSGYFKIRLTGIDWYYGNPTTMNAGYCGAVYSAGQASLSAFYIVPSTVSPEYNYQITPISKTEVEFTPSNAWSNVPYKYVRFSGKGTAANAKIEVSYTGVSGDLRWADTGLTYTPAEYEERIVALENAKRIFADDIEELQQAVEKSGSSDFYGEDIISFRLANPVVYEFMTETLYDPEDYSTSAVFRTNYQSYRADRPLPVIIKIPFDTEAVTTYVICSDQSAHVTGGYAPFAKKIEVPYGAQRVQLYNLIPGTVYYYKICYLYADGTSKTTDVASFATEGKCTTRMLHIDGVNNARDLGGYACEGGRVVYGKLYRSSAFDEAAYSEYRITDKGIRELVLDVGVRAELDLRSSARAVDLGDGIDFLGLPFESYGNSVNAAKCGDTWKKAFDFIAEEIAANKPVIFHCQGGADRTGTLAAVLQGVLGVSENEINKEYELTSSFTERKRNSSVYGWEAFMTALKTYGTGSLQENCTQFLLDCGVEQGAIDSFRNSMVD